MVHTKLIKAGLFVLLMVVMATSTLTLSYGAGKNDVITGSSAHDKITLLEVADTPDPFSPELTNATFTGKFQVKETDGLGSADDKHNTEFRFFIRHTLVISNILNQEVNTLTGETNVIAPPKENGKDGDKKYFPATVTQLWNGLDAQGNIVTDGAYQYAITGELYRENLKHKGNQDKEPKVKLIGASNSLAGTISVDTAPPVISTIPAQNTVVTNHTPVIVVNYTDASGVDLSTLKIIFNNIDLTSQFSVTSSQATYQIPEKLPDGLCTMAVTIKDILGHSASLTITFSVVSAMGVVTPAGGGTVEVTEAGNPLINSAIEIPPGAVTQDIIAVISKPLSEEIPSLPAGTTAAGPAVKLDTQPQITFTNPITIKIPYNEAFVLAAGRREMDVKLVKFDTVTNQWVNIPATVDATNNLVVAQVTGLSLYQAVLPENTRTVTLTERFVPTDIISTASITGPITVNAGESFDIVVAGTTTASMCNWRLYRNGALFAGAGLVFGSSVNKTFSFTETCGGDYAYITYEFWFRGIKGAHNWPDFTKVSITVTVLPILPNDPSSLIATAISNWQINLQFQDNSDNEQGFRIERKSDYSAPFEIIATIGSKEGTGTTATFLDIGTNLSPETTYYYRVCAYNMTGQNDYSNEANAMTFLRAPSDLTAAPVSHSQINLTLQDNSNVEQGVIIERQAGKYGSFEQIATLTANTVNYSDTGLLDGTLYYYRAKSYNLSGESSYSDETSAVTVALDVVRIKADDGVSPPPQYLPAGRTTTFVGIVPASAGAGTYKWVITPPSQGQIEISGPLTGNIPQDEPPSIGVHFPEPSLNKDDTATIRFNFTPELGDVVEALPHSAPVVKIDLQIYNGLKDWVTPQDWSGGQPIPEDDEESKGAVTVANQNDTDGDNRFDYCEDTVKATDTRGRNEIDLMQLVLNKPVPDLGGTVTLKLLGATDFTTRTWQKPTKEDPETRRVFLTSELPVTMWVEAVMPTGLRQIGYQLKYQGAEDLVKATAVWVRLNKAYYTRASSGDENKIPDNLDNTDVLYLRKQTIINYQASDGSYYGFGPYDETAGEDTTFGGRILFEWQIQPSGVDNELKELGVLFDVTRQVKSRDYFIESGEQNLPVVTPPNSDEPTNKQEFPENQNPRKDNETPNDNGNKRDEDNIPCNSMIYSYDIPGEGSIMAGGDAFSISRKWFKEWVRIRLSPYSAPPDPNPKDFLNTNGVVEGSCASDKKDWHLVYYLVRDTNGKWKIDTMPVTCSAPLKKPWTIGDGTITATPLGDAVTEGFKAVYSYDANSWLLFGTSDLVAVSSPQVGATWTLNLYNRVNVTITQGSVPFKDGDAFSFSTFKTYASGGKESRFKLEPFYLVESGP